MKGKKMKHKKSIIRICIALLLVLCVGISIYPLTPVKAQEENDISNAENITSEVDESENNPVVLASDNVDSDAMPFDMQVTFDGQTLNENSTNAIANTWSGNSSKMMTVTVNRNKNVAVDPDKQYILCMKTSDTFYFNGLPDVSKINGAEDVTIVKNSAPIVNKAGGTSGPLTGFSNYSGEIRIKLNSVVDIITIPDVGVNYNVRMLGYNGDTQTVSNPVQVRLISADQTSGMDQITVNDKDILHQVQVDSVSVQTASLGSITWKTAMSTDSFKNAVLMQSVILGKDGHVSYYLGTNGVEYQIYKTLKIEVACPYVEVDGKKYYLEFDPNDTALTKNVKQNDTVLAGNEKPNAKGYTMANQAVYDASNHTFTYTFENIYLGEHTPLLYTPDYKWPSALADKTLDKEYVVQGVSFTVTEQTGYLGNTSKLQTKFIQNTKYTATFIQEGVNVKMASSAESGDDVAKRYIYKDVTRKNGIEGTLGFFDIHNEGTKDTSLLDIKYEFNTSNTGAVYYVTQVNLAAYGTTGGTDVTYVLSNGSDEKTGTKHYNNNSSFSCFVADLRKDCNADDAYYIKSVSYQTCLQQGTNYHLETAHLNRNRKTDSGLFFGYLEGELGTTASAMMTISAVDSNTPITVNDKTTISSTETSTVADEDYIGMRISGVNVDGAASQMISAGSSVTLNIEGYVTPEEYPVSTTSNQVNGYHVLRDGIFYICLPEGVSIAGAAQVKVSSNGKSVTPGNPERITDSVTVNGVQAYWWAIPVNGLNTRSDNTVRAAIELSTSESMAGVVWDFTSCVGIRAKGQRVSWAAASQITSLYNSVKNLTNSTNAAICQLGSYLSSNGETDDLGVEILNQNGNVKLNIARAEAKLDVTTSLATSETYTPSDTVSISNENSSVTYDVEVACTEQGAANNFNYYIPIVHTDSKLDTGALVSQKEIGLQLSQAVNITSVGSADSSTADLPFDVLYTTDSNLDSSNIQGSSVKWETSVTDYTTVTAVRIATKKGASVKQGESYQFSVVMKYDNSNSDFEQQAGSIAAWRSFGHYTYTRNGATTTNSYPSNSNSVKIRYVTDLTQNPMTVTLDTSADKNNVDTSQKLPTTFVNEQRLVVKKVTPSNGTQLISEDPASLTGADANSKFRLSFNLNNGSAVTLPSIGAGWSFSKNTEIMLQANAFFSKALTDITTDRYVDVEIGNENVDITCRVKLVRKVAAASANGSGVALGEQYLVPTVSDSCSISKDSAFTALYVIKNFVPGNYSSQLLKWQKSDGTESDFPTGTTITMMEVDESSKVTSYWYCQPTGTSVDLKNFKRMAGNETYSYDTSTTSGKTLRYLFVVNFGQANAETGDYQLSFDAGAKNGASAFTPAALNVSLGATKGYGLSASTVADSQQPGVNINYTITTATGNDSYTEGRSLSLVLTPDAQTAIPKDSKIVCGNQTYTCNRKGDFIIPLGNIESGTADLVLTSQMFPDTEQTYHFDAKLYLSNSAHDEAAENGQKVVSSTIVFSKSEVKKPALKITGTQIADQNEWVNGQPLNIELKNLEGYTLTVTVCEGINDNQKVTDLVSSVSGKFEIKGGVGSYKPENTSDDKLILSSTAKPGTYRLVFEVKRNTGELVMTVPYYFIVR